MASGRRQVVDREGQRGAFPDAAVQPGQYIVFEPAASRGPGVKREPAQLEVDLAAVERQGVERRADLRRQAAAQVLREG